jgi:hypothetical protein
VDDSTARLDLDVQLTNNSISASLQRVKAIRATLDMYCPPSSGICTDTFITYDLPIGVPFDVGTIAPDSSSSPMTLGFYVDAAVLRGVQGLFGRSGRLHLDVTYDVAGSDPLSRQASLDLSLGAPQSAPDLEVRSYEGTVTGNAVDYVAVVRNTGNPQVTAPSVQLWVTIPGGARLVVGDRDLTDPACSTQQNGNYVVCDAGAMNPFGSRTFRFRFDVSNVPAGAVGTTASVRSANDPDDSNNSKVAFNTVGSPFGTHTNLAVTIDDQDDPVGNISRGPPNVRFTITVRNTGSEPAANVRVEVDSFLNAIDYGCFVARQGRPPICNLGDIPAGGSAIARIAGRISVPGLFFTIATVTSSAIESDYSDNVDIERTTVQPGFAD